MTGATIVLDALARLFASIGLIILIACLIKWILISRRMQLALMSVTWSTATLSILAVIGLATAAATLKRMDAQSLSDILGLATGIMMFITAVYFFLIASTYSKIEFGEVDTLIGAGMFAGIHEKVAAMYGERPASHLLYAIGKSTGHKNTKYLFETILKSKRGRALRVFKYLLSKGITFMGYARKSEVMFFEPEKRVVVKMIYTAESTGIPHSKGSGCDMVRGMLAGMGEALHPDKVCETVENMCELKGDPYCEFEIRWYPRLKPEEMASEERKKGVMA